MQKQSVKILLLLSLSLFFLVPKVEARWATIDDADVATNLYNITIKVNKDGTYIETIEFVLEPLKESGKDRLVSMPLVYNAGNSKIKVLSAKVIDQKGIEHPVDLTKIEDKPLASSPQGFDQKNQLLIAFPEIELNSKIYLKYQKEVQEAAVPGFFSTDFIYGTDSFWKESHVQVSSALPFFLKENDVDHLLEIKQTQKNALYCLDVVLKKPVIKVPVNEQYPHIDAKIFPWVRISTLQEWSKLGNMLAPRYEEIVNEPLPAIFQNIVNEAKVEKTLVDKINKITTRLAETITYMGDWRTIKGALIPRHLDEIAKSKIGDCKDLSATTAAILRALSIKAFVAVVRRGEEQEFPSDLPVLGDFNHAIVAVLDGKKILWIDPTNFTSFAQGIYPDIENRKSLVLDPAGSKLVVTTALSPKDSEVKIIKNIVLPKTLGAASQVRGSVSLKGTSALSITGADLMASKETINHALLNALTDESRIETWHIDDYDLTSRVVSDLKFNFDFAENYSQLKTTSGRAFLFPADIRIAKLLTKTKDRVTALAFEIPSIHRFETLLTHTSLVGDKFLNCQVDSPWFAGIRDIQNTKDGIKILDTITVKKRKILNTELNSKAYNDLQKEVFACFGDMALVYDVK